MQGKNGFSLALTATVLLTYYATPMAMAQGWGVPSKDDRATIEAKKKKSKEKFTSSRVKTLQTIPFVPPYPASGASLKLIRALQYSSLGKNEHCIVQTFLVRDMPSQVRDWYVSTLNSGGWTLQQGNKTGMQVIGRRRKDGTTVHLMVSNVGDASERKKGFRTSIQLRYIQWSPIKES